MAESRTITAPPIATIDDGEPPADERRRSGWLVALRAGRSRTRTAALALVLVLDLVIPIAQAWQASLVVPVYHLDGSFQTASGLFRLASGQWPGKDFFPYLGTGPVLLLYPVFWLLGGHLTSSVFSARLLTLLSLGLVVGLVSALVCPRRRRWAFAWGAAVPMLVLVAATLWPQLWTAHNGFLGEAALPGTSLRPIRAVAPYLLAGVAFAVLRSRVSLRRLAVVGACAGLIAALWSNDYGLVSGLLLPIAVSIHLFHSQVLPQIRALGALWGAVVAGYVVSGFAATAGHFTALLSYNFSDVRGDQFWYFGAWGTESRVYSLGDLLRIMATEHAIYPLVVLAAALVSGLRRRDLAGLLLSFLGASVLAGGVAATWGGHAGGYFWAFALWGYVVTGVALARLVPAVLRLAARLVPAPARRTIGRGARVALAAGMVLALLGGVGFLVEQIPSTYHRLASDPGFVHEPELGGYLDAAFERHVDLMRGKGSAVLEEYMGLAGAENGPTLSLPVDSVIAALGRQREVFAAAMARPHQMVVTTAPSMSAWVTWNISADWWLYRKLFKSYAPEQTSPYTLVWRPTTPATWAKIPCRVGASGIELAAPSAGLYDVTLRYRGPGRGSRSYTMVENDINVAAGAQGFVALDPGARSQQFPVAVRDPAAGPTRLGLRDVPGSPLTTLTSCTASSIRFPAKANTERIFSGLFFSPVDYTDANWDHGVQRGPAAAFFVLDTVGNRSALKPGRTVRFSDGSTRVIRSAAVAGGVINVYLDGKPLDARTAGAPHAFTLLSPG